MTFAGCNVCVCVCTQKLSIGNSTHTNKRRKVTRETIYNHERKNEEAKHRNSNDAIANGVTVTKSTVFDKFDCCVEMLLLLLVC